VQLSELASAGLLRARIGDFSAQSVEKSQPDPPLRFTDVTVAAGIRYLGWGIGCVDLDNDGWHDLFAVKYRQRKLIFLNQRAGTFRDVSALVGSALGVAQPSRGAAFGDLENDGRIDVVIGNI
jgi:hypothetical protein